MNKKLLSLDRKNSIFPKVTKASTSGQRIDCNGVGVLRGQQPPRGGGTRLYKPYGYVPPQRVGFLLYGIWKLGLDFAHFSLESSMVYEGITFVYQFVCRFSP